MRKSGILMPVSALPSSTGVGELGPAAWHWIQVMEENGVKIWQILPLNPLHTSLIPPAQVMNCISVWNC